MAQLNTFNIADLYLKAFGIKGVRFAIPEITNNIDQGGLYGSEIQVIPLPKAKIQSVLGTPIYEQITLTIPAIVESGNIKTPQKSYTLPGWPLFDITGQKTIIKTPMQGKKGTVKEFINEDDFAITIRGFLINYESQDFPEQQLEDLMQVIRANVSLGITSQIFNLLDIHNIVIERYRFPEVEGFQNMQPFELECVSDEPVELEIRSVKAQKRIVSGL